MSLLVPVFTAVQMRVASTLSAPKVCARALLSARMSPTMNAAPGGSTARPGLGAGEGWRRVAEARPPLASAR